MPLPDKFRARSVSRCGSRCLRLRYPVLYYGTVAIIYAVSVGKTSSRMLFFFQHTRQFFPYWLRFIFFVTFLLLFFSSSHEETSAEQEKCGNLGFDLLGLPRNASYAGERKKDTHRERKGSGWMHAKGAVTTLKWKLQEASQTLLQIAGGGNGSKWTENIFKTASLLFFWRGDKDEARSVWRERKYTRNVLKPSAWACLAWGDTRCGRS